MECDKAVLFYNNIRTHNEVCFFRMSSRIHCALFIIRVDAPVFYLGKRENRLTNDPLCTYRNVSS